VADTNDPVVPIVRGLMAEHPHIEARLLIGRSDISTNPKLNNLVKGCYAARYNWILMVDICSIGWAASRRLPAKWPKMLPQPRRSGNWA
jgi:hypothetical protein